MSMFTKGPAGPAMAGAGAEQAVAAGVAPGAESVAPAGGAEQIMLRNRFYRDGYRKLFSVATFLAIALIVSLLGNVLQMITKPEPRYFATTMDGQLIPMVSLDQPNLSDQSVLNWASEAIPAANTFDFLNYRQQLQQVGLKYFTSAGFTAYLKELKANGNLDRIKQNRLIAKTVLRGAPVLIGQGVMGSRYVWKVRAPVLVSYEGGTEAEAQKGIVTALIVRSSTLEYEKGVAIEQFVLSTSLGN